MKKHPESKVTQWMVDQLVAPEHQYRDAVDPPLDPIRMAWPFKTEEERKQIQKWMRQQTKRRKIEFLKIGDALL